MTINYVTGDATDPQGSGLKVICHICNDAGAWGKGFVVALSKRWRSPETGYRAIRRHVLGAVDFFSVESDIIVANMIAQRGLPSRQNPEPLDCEELRRCLIKVGDFAHDRAASIHMPKIGSGLARGDWSEISRVIDYTLAHVSVSVYILPKLEELR
jgi:O-acetyl-ADP-ribose deacetylase (regulator of RNase III)